MKKLAVLISIGIVLTTASAFGQAYFTFAGTPRTVADDTLGTGVFDANFDAVFLWGTVGETPLVSGIMNGTPTNNLSIYFSNGTAWQDVLSDPNFTIAATNGGAAYIATGTAFGSFAADADNAVPVAGTTVGTTYAVIVVAWKTDGGLYTTPQAAAAAGAPIGWSPVLDYTPGSAPPAVPPSPIDPSSFGIWATPEPTTLTLAALGGISMILVRRRKG